MFSISWENQKYLLFKPLEKHMPDDNQIRHLFWKFASCKCESWGGAGNFIWLFDNLSWDEMIGSGQGQIETHEPHEICLHFTRDTLNNKLALFLNKYFVKKNWKHYMINLWFRLAEKYCNINCLTIITDSQS